MKRFSATVALIAALAALATASYEDPNSAMEGVYEECVVGMSWSCLQRRTLNFVESLGRPREYPLMGGFLTLVRLPLAGPDPPPVGEAVNDSEESLGRAVDDAIERFFDGHLLRLHLPAWLTPSGGARATPANSVDFKIGDTAVVEGRKKVGGKKGMKKMMMMMCMMMAGKAMTLVPLMLGLIKLAAIKALIMSFISLTISKILILKKLKMKGGGFGGGGGGGHGGWGPSGGGGGGGGLLASGGGYGGGGHSSGWDRRSIDSHGLAYASYLPNSP